MPCKLFVHMHELVFASFMMYAHDFILRMQTAHTPVVRLYYL